MGNHLFSTESHSDSEDSRWLDYEIHLHLRHRRPRHCVDWFVLSSSIQIRQMMMQEQMKQSEPSSLVVVKMKSENVSLSPTEQQSK
jgi:hypothetical protein